MFSFAVSLFIVLFLLFAMLLYTLTRLILINDAISGIINLKKLSKKINFGANLCLFFEMVVSTISIIPPIVSPILFILSSIATAYDIYLLSKEKLQIKFPDVTKKLEKVRQRFEIKMWAFIATIAYTIYLIVSQGNAIKRQRYGQYLH